MTPDPELSPGRRRIVESLKTLGPSTPVQLAERLGLTAVAVRQHLAGLEALELVASAPLPTEGRGRPPSAWRLTSEAMALFPDRHGELTVGLIDAIRDAVGGAGLERILDARGAAQSAQYATRIPEADLRARVEALAALRSQEGYMAEVRSEPDGSLLLIEHHCPICVAATSCLGLCRVELDVFQSALGPTADVERVAHLLDGDARCVYRIRGA